MIHLFVELATADAKATLENLRDNLAKHPGTVRVTLLEAVKQPGLFLLLYEGADKPTIEPPEGAKLWLFQPC